MKRWPNQDPGDIEMWCGRGFNEIMYAAFKSDPSNFDLYCKQDLVADVQQNTDTDEFYCMLPKQICQLPDHAEGVRRVRKLKGHAIDFVPVQKDSVPVFDGMIEVFDPTVGYSVGNDRIIFEKAPGVDRVRMDLVIPFEEYDMEDYIYIPLGQDDALISAVAKFIEGTPPENIKP
jgi:hypothetical protein